MRTKWIYMQFEPDPYIDWLVKRKVAILESEIYGTELELPDEPEPRRIKRKRKPWVNPLRSDETNETNEVNKAYKKAKRTTGLTPGNTVELEEI